MRILFLSANTGGGHNTAAASVVEAFTQKGIECEIKDAVSFVSELHSDIISTGHTYIYRHLPRLFGIGYRFEEKHPPKFLYEQMALGAKRFAAYLNANPYDAVVCTHIFGSMLMTEVRARFGIRIPHYAVITDYTLYPGSTMVDVDRFFIPSEDLREQYRAVGIDDARIVASGIPIHSRFFRTYDQKEVRRKLHLPENGRIVLLISGSIGCGRLDRIAPELENRLPEDTTLVIVCGHNRRAYRQLKEVCRPGTVIIGYTTRISDYMAAADLCISKPGGLSTTEMLVMGLPSILMLSVPGCETRNIEFFANYRATVCTEDWDEAISLTGSLIRDTDRLLEMRERLREIPYPGGATCIVDTVLNDLSNTAADRPREDESI